MDGVTAQTSPPEVERHRFTSDDVRRMIAAGILPDKAPLELLNGDLIVMPSEGDAHWHAKQRLVSWLLRRLPADVDLAPDGPLRLGLHDEPEPDIFLFPSAMNVNAVRGEDVILVIEVADTSLRKDGGAKAAIYAAHGVETYWIVDLNARRTLIRRLDGASYAEPQCVPFAAALAAPGVAEPLVIASVI
jgi:Uma2 family endonuclease